MKKSKITIIFVLIILAIIFLSIPTKVIAVETNFTMSYDTGSFGIITRGIMGIYKAIYNSNPKYSPSRKNDWLSASSNYIGGDGSENDWRGEYFVTNTELTNMGLTATNRLVQSKYAACVGHRTNTDSGYSTGTTGDLKRIRVININTPNSTGLRYQDGVTNGFNATNVDVLTLGILVKEAVNSSDYRNCLVFYWYDNKDKYLIDDGVKNLIDQSHSSDTGDEYSEKHRELRDVAKKRAQEIANTKLTSTSKESDGIARMAVYNDGYTFIGPYSINTAGGATDKLEAKITLQDGTTITTGTFSTSTNKDSVMDFTNGSVNLSNYSSTSLYIAVQGEISGTINTVKVYRYYKTVQARIVAVVARANKNQNFIMFDGSDIDGTIEISLPVPKGVEVQLKKVDSDTGKELTGVRFVLQDTNTKEYLAKTTGGATKRVTDPGTNYSNVTIFASGSSINIDKDGTYRIIEIQSEKVSSSDSRTYYNKANTSEPIEIGTIIVSDSKVTTSSSDITVSNGNAVTVTLKNTIKYFHIRIYKTDLTTGETLHNVKFVLKYKNTGEYVKQENDNDAEYVSDVENATQFSIPSDKSYLDISYLTKEGTYEVYEVQRENDAYVHASLDKQLLVNTLDSAQIGKTYEIKITNEKKYRNLKLIKVDQDSKEEIEEMGIVLYDETDKGYFIGGNDENEPLLTNDISKATKYETKKGGIDIKYLARNHSYIVYEVENPIYGYTEVSLDKPLELGKFTLSDDDVTLEYTVENLKRTGNLIIEKEDIDNNDLILEGISFKIQNSKGEYIIALDEDKREQLEVNGKIYLGGLKTTTNINSATEFITDKNARIEIYNILMDTYTVIETSVGDNFGYDTDSDYVSWETSGNTNGTGATATVVVNRQKSQDTEINTANMSNEKYDKLVFKNKRKYIKISGLAWEDIASGKGNDIDEVWTDETGDKKLKNITVRLKTSSGDTIATKVTDSDGKYIFGNYDEDETAIKIKIDDIIGGYIEFEYNGLSYKTVSINSTFTFNQGTNNGNVINGINNSASDTSNRDEFNKRFETISYNVAHDANNGKNHDLSYRYDEEKHESYHEFLGNDIKYGYDEQEQPVSGMEEYYLINAVTNKNEQKALCTGYGADDIRQNSVTEIAGINLGITIRAQADLAISSDLDKVNIAINTGTDIYENTYTYAKRNIEEENSFGIETKFGNGTGSYSNRGLKTYTRRIYESDLAYSNDNQELMKIYVTYKIRVKNQSTILTSKIKEIVNYYDSRYTIEKSWIGEDENNSVNWTGNNEIGQGYKAGYTNAIGNTEIEPGGYIDIYIKFKLDNTAVKALIEKQTTLNNVSEISEFSTVQNGQVYAAIDIDSNPGSAEIVLQQSETTTTTLNGRTYEIENKILETTSFEDDTDMAPSLILGIEESDPTRGLSGTVFEDDSINGDETTPNQERIGDGILENDRYRVGNAKVELLDEDGNIVKLYELSVNSGVISTTEKDAVTYTDANGEYSFLGVMPGKYLIRYTYNNETYIMKNETQYNIDPRDYKSTIITSDLIKTALNLNKEIDSSKEERMGNLSWILSYEGKRYSDAVDDMTQREKLDNIDYANTTELAMRADTAYFEVGVEYSDVTLQGFNEKVSFTDYKDEYNLEGGKIIVLENGKIKVKDTFYAVNPYQDFGIVERPRQVYDVNKRVTNLKVILANGQVLINGNPYKTEIGEEYAKWNEIEKAADPALQYVKALPGSVIAEIDNEIMQGTTLSLEYAISIKNDAELDYTETEYYYYGTGGQNVLTSVIKKVADYMEEDLVYDDKANAELGWEKIEPKKLKDWDGKKLVKDEVYTEVKDGYTIAVTENFNTELAPGTAKTVKLYGSKLLTTDENGIGVSNYVEIIETARKIYNSTPGNYIPGLSSDKIGYTNEPDDDQIRVSITPPTGLTDNITFIITVASITVVVLLAGIYFIKAKALE